MTLMVFSYTLFYILHNVGFMRARVKQHSWRGKEQVKIDYSDILKHKALDDSFVSRAMSHSRK